MPGTVPAAQGSSATHTHHTHTHREGQFLGVRAWNDRLPQDTVRQPAMHPPRGPNEEHALRAAQAHTGAPRPRPAHAGPFPN